MEILALYLPQFHPIPENDLWWEPGFTEWTNVTRARPLFPGHHQPRLPADLGYYDLRVPEAREGQADLARRFGVTGFCYWHYWFAGRRLLQRPLEEVVASGTPDFPFCVSWANQSWSGIWHGAPDRMLIEQTYPGLEDDVAHFEYLRAAFEDPRYITVGGRPVMFVYQPGFLPRAAEFVERWQGMATDAGFSGLYLVASLGESDYRSHVEDGFDAAVHFQVPLRRDTAARAREQWMARGPGRGPRHYPYADSLPEPPPDLRGRLFPSVYPNWDNTPRLGRRGTVATGSTPERFGRQVGEAIARVQVNPVDEQVVVIKAWNEWAEGNYLEPDLEYGLGRLEALAAAVAASQRPDQ
jgi:lipopolysaccharide biosynthesis protein